MFVRMWPVIAALIIVVACGVPPEQMDAEKDELAAAALQHQTRSAPEQIVVEQIAAEQAAAEPAEAPLSAPAVVGQDITPLPEMVPEPMPTPTVTAPPALHRQQTQLESTPAAWPDDADNLLHTSHGASNTAADSESDSYPAANLLDADDNTSWRSSEQVNDLIFDLGGADPYYCFDRMVMRNYGSDRSLNSFMLFTTDDPSLSEDFTNGGWHPIVAETTPSGTTNHLLWAQGGRLVRIEDQYNTTYWAAANIHDGDVGTIWLNTSQQINELDFGFDTDWNGNVGNLIEVDEIALQNYGSERSVKFFQVEVQVGGNWRKLEVPGSAAGDADFNFLHRYEGAALTNVDGEYNDTYWAAVNSHDGNDKTRWMNRARHNNVLDYTFDTDFDGETAVTDADDRFTLEKIHLINYGSERSVRYFQVGVKTATVPDEWTLVAVPGTAAGDPDFNFLWDFESGELTRVDGQYDDENYPGSNIHDGNPNTAWYNISQYINELEFEVDANGDGLTGAAGDAADLFTVEKVWLNNYGNSRSVKTFQVEVQTQGSSDWHKLETPGSGAGDADFNFLNRFEGATTTRIDGEYNDTTRAAANVHDGSRKTYWLNTARRVNEIDFAFDTDLDGSTMGAGDLFTMEKFQLHNYGSESSIRFFQVGVKTSASPDEWTMLPVPGTVAAAPDFNFLWDYEGGLLTRVESEYNDSNWAGANIHDGNDSSAWLNRSSVVNELEFAFDSDLDGTTADAGDSDDLFELEKLRLDNYGSESSVQKFQVEVQQGSAVWSKLEVPGTAAGAAGFNFLSRFEGAENTRVAGEYNDTYWAARNFHDDNPDSFWLNGASINNELEFRFDPDLDTSFGSEGDSDDHLTIEQFYLVNYGNNRSLKEFQVEVQTQATPAWTKVPVPGTAAGDADFNYLCAHEGGIATLIDTQQNETYYAGANLNDCNSHSRWLASASRINVMEYAVDNDLDGTSGADGDTDDYFDVEKIRLHNYGNDRSIKYFQVEVQTLADPSWTKLEVPGSAAGDGNFNFAQAAKISPYSMPCDLKAEMVAAGTLQELEQLEAAGKILVLYGELCREQIMPKNYVFYNPDHHKAFIALLESKRVAAVVAITTKDPQLAGAVYPFPLFDDGDLNIPSVYMTDVEGQRLLQSCDGQLHLRIESCRIPSWGQNVIATKRGLSEQRIVVCAHLDTKRGTPGALDNGASTVLLLTLAGLLKDYRGHYSVELLSVNGEDYYAASGELNYLQQNPELKQGVVFMVNADALGHRGVATGVSSYELGEAQQALVHKVLCEEYGMEAMEPWFQSDHMVFVQNGVPAIALTSMDCQHILASVAHTQKDTLDLVDPDIIYRSASALKRLLESFVPE